MFSLQTSGWQPRSAPNHKQTCLDTEQYPSFHIMPSAEYQPAVMLLNYWTGQSVTVFLFVSIYGLFACWVSLSTRADVSGVFVVPQVPLSR